MLSNDIGTIDGEVDVTSLSSAQANSADSKGKKPTQILSAQELGVLNQKSDLKGFLQLCSHLAIMGSSGYLWATSLGNLSDRAVVAIPALVIYGFSLAIMFAPLHECSHRTAFANNKINDVVAWLAGLLSFYNSTFYRLYHKWHHRYTQIIDKDPELGDRKPTNLGEYILEISGFNWWVGKLRGHWRVATGQLDGCPYIPEDSRDRVILSTRLQLLVYAVAIAVSLGFAQPWFWLYWVLPLAIGQPFLRILLLAEHSDRPNSDNLLTNTRTTLTLAPLRFLIWQISFHAEHHLYASIPFHQLAAAHEKLGSHFDCVESGYVNVHRQIIANLGKNVGNAKIGDVA
jgi:fatty acid desaturase